MDPLLALIRDLYAQVQQLAQENADLRAALDAKSD